MKREIKFRAWGKFEKKFHYPKLWDSSMPSNWEHWYDLQQFTGLKDKNGVEIYEGDIIKVPSEDYDYCLCEWHNKNCCFQINGYGRNMYFNEGGGEVFSNDISLIEDHVWVLGGDDNIEVIGNIYENPEPLTPLTNLK